MHKDILSTAIALAVVVIISVIRRLKDSQGARVIQGCESYIQEQITTISPVDPVLGGSRQVTDIISS